MSTNDKMPVQRSNDSPDFDPFRRSDRYGDMGKDPQPLPEKLRLILFAVLIFPLRCLGVIFCVVTCFSVCKLSGFISDEETRFAFVSAIGKVLSRICLFVSGFHSVKWVRVGGKASGVEACGIVSNHVSWADILVHMSQWFPSFVAKEATKELPLVGVISQMMGCIYVKRDNKRPGEKGVSGEVCEKMLETSKTKSPYRRMLLFPEGTTTNGKFLLPFKKGAFLAGVPIQPVILTYSSAGVSPAWESISGPWHIFLVLCAPSMSVTCYQLPVYSPSEDEKKDPELFARNVHAYMLKNSHLEASESTWEVKKEYHKLLKATEG